MLKKGQVEAIICSAIWFDDKIIHPNQPFNIKTGYVVSGHRHHNCFATAYVLMGNADYLKHEKEQGFLTNTGNFVDRETAWKIAVNANQVDPASAEGKASVELFSEDLY